MILTEKILKSCMPHATDANIKLFVSPLNLTCEKYEINTPRRQAAFLAQVAHESWSLKYTAEIATGEAYEGRKDLGNTEPGDGIKFKGRGLIQITGRFNYDLLSHALNYNFIAYPESLEKPGAASLSAGWFWHVKELNRIADIDGFERISIKINGAKKVQEKQPDGAIKSVLRANGWEDRLKHWETCRKALNVTI